MTNIKTTTTSIRHLLLLLIALPGWAFAQGAGPLIIFGDSVSDTGNFFHVTGNTVKAPFEPIPDAPYSIGGNHFSNGVPWPKRLADILQANPSTQPATINPIRFTNYAFGRARARAGAEVFAQYDLATQVGLFLSDFDNRAPSDATYIIFIGSNDARDAFAAGGDPTIVAAAVGAIGNGIAALFDKGARNFVVFNIPNLAITPAVNKLPPPFPALATEFTLAFNAALSQALDAVEPLVLSDGGQIIRGDAFALLNGIVADGGATTGLTNVEDSCLTYGVTGRFMCNAPDTYLFWDDAHPTRAGHNVIAEEVAAILSAP